MSFTRLNYDTCSYAQNLNTNVSYLSYLMDTSRNEHCTPCRNQLGLVGGNNVSKATGSLVDLESNLFGIDRPQTSKCTIHHFKPHDGEYEQGIGQYKTTCYPKIPTDKKHLNSCQFFSYPGVPTPPSLDLHKC
jgi:hypothetical protein